MNKVKVKATKKLNLGHLEGMDEGDIAYLSEGDEKILPDLPIVRFYIEHGGLELLEEIEEKPEEKTEIVEDKPTEEETVKDTPKKKKGGTK